MVRVGLGMVLLLLLGSQVGAGSTDTCEVRRLVAAQTYVGCLSRALWHDSDAEADFARCDARLERRLARADCGSPAQTAALGVRLRTALEIATGDADVEARFTPVVMSVLTPPHPVTGSDGRTHLVYELQIANASSLEWRIETIEVLDGDVPASVLLTIEGDEVAAKIRPLDAGAMPGASLGSGASAVVFLHLPLEPGAAIPANLIHRLTLSLPGGLPEPLRAFAGLPADAEFLEEQGGRTAVASRPPVVLGPPLAGDGWLAADGCCTAHRHIRALLTINGELTLAQRFAIDWERLNEDDRLFVGDPRAVESYFAYGAPVLAVADARIARVLDGLEEQVPGALPAVIPLTEADGNHVVLDLGDGRFVLYAHMIPGSITVAEGDRVARGEVLGLVGNSGNTSAPHLHLHVMSAPSALAANGLPYVIDAYELLGRAPSTAAFDEAEANGTPLEILPVDFPGAHEHDLPLDLSLVRFPGG